MDAKQMYYQTLSAYNEKYLFAGLLFTLLLVIGTMYAFKNRKKQTLLLFTIVASLLWVAWVLLFITTWFHNYSLLAQYPMVIWALVMEPLWTIILTVASIILLKDLFGKRITEIRLPQPLWEKIFVVCFLAISVCNPIYYMALGFKYPTTMFVGIGPFPTFTFCGIVLAGSLPKANRWLVLLIMLAIFGSIPSLAGGLWENVILVPPFIYMLYKVLKFWNLSKEYEKKQ